MPTVNESLCKKLIVTGKKISKNPLNVVFFVEIKKCGFNIGHRREGSLHHTVNTHGEWKWKWKWVPFK